MVNQVFQESKKLDTKCWAVVFKNHNKSWQKAFMRPRRQELGHETAHPPTAITQHPVIKGIKELNGGVEELWIKVLICGSTTGCPGDPMDKSSNMRTIGK